MWRSKVRMEKDGWEYTLLAARTEARAGVPIAPREPQEWKAGRKGKEIMPTPPGERRTTSHLAEEKSKSIFPRRARRAILGIPSLTFPSLMSLSPVFKLTTLGMLALTLSACSHAGSAEPTSGPTAKPTETPAMTSTPIAMETKMDGKASPSPATSSTPRAMEKTMQQFTMAEVATHNDGESCYIVYKGGVYDITAFVPKHPKGPAPLTKCGQAVDDFSQLHPGGTFDNSPERIAFMESMKIGTIK